jgi:hypothetical protein
MQDYCVDVLPKNRTAHPSIAIACSGARVPERAHADQENASTNSSGHAVLLLMPLADIVFPRWQAVFFPTPCGLVISKLYRVLCL